MKLRAVHFAFVALLVGSLNSVALADDPLGVFLDPYRLSDGQRSPVEYDSGNYYVSAHILHGRINEVSIRRLDSAGNVGPEWALARKFTPRGIDFNTPTRTGTSQTNVVDVVFYDWDFGGERPYTIRLQVQTHRGTGALADMSWMWKSANSQVWGR